MSFTSIHRRIDQHSAPTPGEPTVEHSRGARVRRLARVASIGALLATVGGGVLAPSASAATLATSGTVGSVGLPTGKCTHYPTWKRLDVTTAAPRIYAPNLRAGGGNDSAWVRYQLLVVDNNRNLVDASTYSGWSAAYDNQAASFTGSNPTFMNIPNYSRVFIVVEWYGMGSAVYQLDQYQIYVKGLSLPYGPADSCAKYTPPGYISA